LTINYFIEGTIKFFGRLAMNTLTEQRKEVRAQLSWPVSVWLPEAHRFFNARSSNISKTGVFLTMPVTAPVRAGNTVELNFPRTTQLAKEKGSFARIKSGRIVRIERENVLKDANIGIAVRFNS
jgi:hypothetical protein